MKNFLNLNQLSMSWNEKQKMGGMRRYAAMLIMLLTLGVGQAWGWGWTQFESTSPATIYPGDQVTLQILLNGDGNGATYKAIGSGTTNAQANLTWNNSDTYYDYVEKAGDNHRWKFYFTPNSTGTWYWSIWLGWGSSVGNNGRYYNGSTSWNEGNSSYQSSSVTVSAVPKSGSLSAESAGTTSIALSWSKNSLNDDVIIFNGNSKTPSDGSTYNVGSNNVVYKGSGTSATITGLTANTSYTFYIYSIHQTKYYSASNNATAKTDDVATPAITLTSVSPASSIVAGNDITLVGTRANSSNAISFQYTTNDGSTWTDISPKTSSTVGNATTATWTVPDAHGATQTFKFRACLAADSKESAKSSGVTVYNTKTIHVKNTNSWGTLYLYAWDGSGTINGAWPGKTGDGINGFSCTNVGGGLWWDVTITSRATGFNLDQNVSGDANQTADLSYSSYTHDRCYAIGTNSGKRTLSNTTVSCLTDAEASTAEADEILRTSAKLGGSVDGNGNDKIISYGYYYTTNSALSSSNVIGTRVEVGTDNKSGAYTKSQTGLSANTTYYVMAYAKNGNGEAYGDVESFTTLAQYTVTTGVVTGQSARGSVSPASVTCSSAEWSSNVTASANAGYSFDAWTTGEGVTKQGSTSPTKVKATQNSTIKASFNEVMRTVGVTVNNSYLGSVDAASLTSVGPVTKSAEVTATAETGASFSSWTLPSGVTAAAGYTTSSNPIKVNATEASKTITANFTETTYTVTLSTADGSKGTVGSNQSVGRITAVQITATPKSGYMFSKWVKTGGSGTVTYYTGAGNGQVEDASGEEKETTYITVTGNVTLQATWEADRSSGYVVHYGNSGTWKDGKLYRATTAASDFSYFTFTAGVGDVDKVIEFKIHQLSPNNWYGYGSYSGGDIDKDISNAALSTSYGNGRLYITMPGSYLFTWDKSTNELSIRYPNNVYYVRGGWDSWSWSHPMTETSSGVYSATINMTEANHTYAPNTEAGFKVLIAGKYYGKDATTVTRSTSTGSAAIGSCSTSGQNLGLTTDYTGDYTFTYTVATNTLQVTYPTAYKVTYGKGTVDGSASTCSAVDLDNGSAAVTSNSTWVKSGNRVTLSGPAAKTGYTWKGWYTDEAGTTGHVEDTERAITVTINAAKTLYACYTENMTTVNLVASPTGKGTFTSGGGAVTSVSAGVATHPEVTAVPASGYRVNTSATVWSESSDYITISATNAAATTITGSGTSGNSATLTATFTPIVYTITLNDNEGSGGVGSATVTFDDDNFAFASSFVAPTRTGYIFQGYYTNGTVGYGDQIINKDGEWIDGAGSNYYIDGEGNWVYAGDKTIYAQWTPITFTIHYDANGGSGSMDDQVVKYEVESSLDGQNSFIDVNRFTAPTGYGTYYPAHPWNTSADGTGTDIDATTYQSTLTSTNGATVNLYAQWSGRFDLEANYDGGVDGYFRVHYNTAIIEAKTTLYPTRLGYLCDGYYTADEDGTKVLNGDGTVVEGNVSGYVTGGKWTYKGTQDFYAHWNQIKYNLAFDGNDCAAYVGTATGSKASLANVEYEEMVDLTAGTIAREGYTFAGWSKTECATSPDYVSTSWNHISATDGDNVTLYAVWNAKNYTISFNALSGDCYTTSKTVAMGANYGSLPTAYGKSGYEFVGWYTRPEGGTEVTEETQMVTASDHTLYAHYEKKERVYFKNTLGWESVYVTWDATWNYNSQDKGAGAKGKTQELMSHIYGTDIWFKDIPAAILSSWKGNIAFTNMAMDDYEWFDEGQAVYRRDFDSDATMFVPTPNDPYKYTKNTHDPKPGTVYYSTDMIVDKDKDENVTNYRYKNGYWVRYDELQSGYTVKGSWAWDDDHYVERHSLNDSTYVFTIRNLSANTDYWFNLYKHCTTSNNYSSVFKPEADMTSADADVIFSARYASGGDKKMHTTVAGDYTFKFVFSALGEIRLTIEYPLAVNDYRVVYGWNDGSAQTFSSEYIKAKADAVDTISMFIHSADNATARSLYIQKCTGMTDGVPTWDDDYSAIALPTETASGKTSGVYNFRIAQNGSAAATGESIGKYEGNYYIRMDSAAGGWDFYKEYPANQMTYSEYSLSQTLSAPYSHYYCQYIGNSTTDISYTIATDYSPAICPILEDDATIGVGNKTLPSGKPASVRFTWNEETNATFRSYLKSAQGEGNERFLVLHGSDNKVLDADGNTIAGEGAGAEQMHANELLFSDTENWVYELAFKAKPGAKVSIIARYNGSDRYLVGAADAWETIISGGADAEYDIAAVYDFKTNRLITTWIPSGTISDQIKEVDVLIERHNQDGATTITFGKAAVDAEAGSISAKRVIGALRFDYNELVGKVANWTPDTRAKMMFFISFPFDVNVSDIFGLNSSYGQAYIVQKYNGALRAEKGFFLGDGTTSFWEILPVDSVMHANVGYVVTMDNDYLNGDVGHVWDNKKLGDHVYLYFPSANDPEEPIVISSDPKTIKIPAHECKINRTFGKLNHKYTDSNWNLMGVPIFQNHTGNATEGTPGAIFTASEEPSDTTDYKEHPDLGYFYQWGTDKNYTIRSAVGFTFLPMHCYMVQYAGDVKFTCAEPSVVPASVAPRRTPMTENYNIDLQVLNSNDEMLNHTYVELRENAVDTFAVNEDTYMLSNSKDVNVYTFAGAYDVAANVLSIGSHVVPVGVIVNRAGTYTFSMPSNFSGNVTLVDNVTGIHTNLALSDYTVDLTTGTNDNRFYLEIDINKTPTSIDVIEEGGSLKDGKAHKFIENGLMYIIKDGVLYDARGVRVQ